MKYLSTAVLLSLSVTTPSSVAYPNLEISSFSIPTPLEIPNPENLSYDEVMTLLELIESDSFEERCSIDKLEQLNQLIAFLALEGAIESEKADIENSIATLFKRDDCQYAYSLDSKYVAQPAIFREGPHVILCKSWCEKEWNQTKKFVKEHKKAIIIGAIVVVAVTVVVVAAVAISASAAATAAAGGIASSASAMESPEGFLTPSLQEQVSTFKESVAQEHLAEPGGISVEENGRILGSLFTHKTIDTLTTQAVQNPFLTHELQNVGNYSLPKWAIGSTPFPHISADLAFSTNYSPTYTGNSDLNTMAYQARGDWALSSGYYNQAVQDFGKAIELEPSNSDSYLGRGIANFELGSYEESVADYHTYLSQTKEPFFVTDFSIGFAKGLPKGIYDSGEGMLLFITDLACHPIQTGEQVYDSLSTLSSLAKSGEWNQIAEALSPELHELVSQWDTLSAQEKGELSGYAFGKHGADVLLPGATAKAVAKGSTAARELGAICKRLQSAEKILVLEAIAEGGAAGANIEKVILSVNKTLNAAEDLGLTTKEVAALKQSGQLKQTIGKGRDFFAGKPDMQASYDLSKKATKTLEPYAKKPMPEFKARELIHETGIPTFPRPKGIPEDFLVMISGRGAGMEYIHPTNTHIRIRVMPGKPHSPNPSQQMPYVIQTKRGKTINKFGEEISSEASEAHIPLSEFVYKE